jgi:Pyridoxamine 5'-phosphate oxidase/Adenylate cyclase regulatory domain
VDSNERLGRRASLVEASGLLDGLEGQARRERAELIAWLLDDGFDVDQIRGSFAQPAKHSQKLSHAEAMRLLASVDYGRVVFTLNALPAIRPVNHLVDEGRIIIRTRLTTSISTVVTFADSGVVVAYEADDFDSQSQSGWSVVATGWGHRVNDPGQVSRYERLLHPWVNHADTVLAIEPDFVTGLRIIASKI